MPTGKPIKGEKYIYLAMAYQLAKTQQNQRINIGNDNGMKGGQQFARTFSIIEYNDEIILNETKFSPHFADFTRSFVVSDIPTFGRPYIYEYINEHGENGSTNWVH